METLVEAKAFVDIPKMAATQLTWFSETVVIPSGILRYKISYDCDIVLLDGSYDVIIDDMIMEALLKYQWDVDVYL